MRLLCKNQKNQLFIIHYQLYIINYTLYIINYPRARTYLYNKVLFRAGLFVVAIGRNQVPNYS